MDRILATDRWSTLSYLAMSLIRNEEDSISWLSYLIKGRTSTLTKDAISTLKTYETRAS
jgi:hypothetical protein